MRAFLREFPFPVEEKGNVKGESLRDETDPRQFPTGSQ